MKQQMKLWIVFLFFVTLMTVCKESESAEIELDEKTKKESIVTQLKEIRTSFKNDFNELGDPVDKEALHQKLKQLKEKIKQIEREIEKNDQEELDKLFGGVSIRLAESARPNGSLGGISTDSMAIAQERFKESRGLLDEQEKYASDLFWHHGVVLRRYLLLL